MAVWLVRAGTESQHEHKFFKDHRIFLTLDGIAQDDFTDTTDYSSIRQILLSRFEGRVDVDIGTLSDIIFEFVMGMMTKDYVVTPRRSPNTLAIGQLISPYGFDSTEESLFNHLHEIRWLALDIPTSSFSPDFQSYFGVSALVCQIKLANAASQIQKALGPKSDVKLEPHISVSTSPTPNHAPSSSIHHEALASHTSVPKETDTTVTQNVNNHSASELTEVDCILENLGLEAVSQVIMDYIKKYGASSVIKAILEAENLFNSTTSVDSELSDFICAFGPFGLGRPKTYVKVLDFSETCDALKFNNFFNSMQASRVDQGLLVSWAGFDTEVIKEAYSNGSKVAIWGKKDILSNFLSVYPKLDEKIRARIPLKQIWIPSNII